MANLCLFCSKCLNEPNRWIPRTIDGSYISSDYLLEQTPHGDGLKLHYTDMCEPFLRLIMLPSSLELSGERDIQICANASKTSLRVKFLRESYPPGNRNPTMKFLVVERENEFSIRQNLPLKGCCLQLLDSICFPEEELEQGGKYCTYLNKFLSNYHKELRFTYDCPIRAELSEDLLLLSHTASPPVSTPCRSDEAHQIQDPCTITIDSSMFFQSCTISWDGIPDAFELIIYANSVYKICVNIVSRRPAVTISPS